MALLALEDGSLFYGVAIGSIHKEVTTAVGEVVFNTSMTGYQEILTDPSYSKQIVTFTYPHIGNTGINSQDNESNAIQVAGLVIRELPIVSSSWRLTETLQTFLQRHNILGIQGIDTRRLTRVLREKGALRGCILTAADLTSEHASYALKLAQSVPSIVGVDLAQVVSTKIPYGWNGGGSWTLSADEKSAKSKPFLYHVVAYDFGIKHSILRVLDDLGCKVTVVPARMPLQEALALKPSGLFFSNGPGDPQPCDYAIETIRQALQKGLPVFGICLGFQLLALALGAKTFKMKFGHHGANHPVRDEHSQRVLITSQNHGFAVEEATLPSNVEITHRSLFDQTIQGFRHTEYAAYGFQGHPEAGPGPNDAKSLFQPFLDLMQLQKQSKLTIIKEVEHAKTN